MNAASHPRHPLQLAALHAREPDRLSQVGWLRGVWTWVTLWTWVTVPLDQCVCGLWLGLARGTWQAASNPGPAERVARGSMSILYFFKTVKLYFVGSSRFVPLADPTVVVSLSRLRPPEARAPSPRATRGRDSPRLCGL